MSAVEEAHTYDGRPMLVQSVVVTDESGGFGIVRSTVYPNGRPRTAPDFGTVLTRVRFATIVP